MILPLALAFIIAIDVIIIRRVWRAVNKGGVFVPPNTVRIGTLDGEDGTGLNARATGGAGILPDPIQTRQPSGGSRFWLATVMAGHGLAFLTLVAFFVFLVPRFQEVYAMVGVKLPAATELVIFLSRHFMHGGFLLVTVLLVLDAVICWLLLKFAGRKLFAAWAVLVLLGSILFVALSLFTLSLPVNQKYKSVSDDQAVRASQNTAFGPVIEGVMDEVINFDSGKVGAGFLTSLPKSNDIAQNVLDGMKGKEIDTNAWEQFTPEQTIGALQSVRRETWQNLKPDEERKTPATWVFETREGGKGILQVLESTEHGVKVRFKLVQEPAAKSFLVAKSAVFHPFKEHVFSEADADRYGLVLVRIGKGSFPPSAVELSMRAGTPYPQMTSDAKRWIIDNKVDMLYRLTNRDWQWVNFDMEEVFVAVRRRWKS